MGAAQVVAEGDDVEALPVLGHERGRVDQLQARRVTGAGDGVEDGVDRVALVDPQQVWHVLEQQHLRVAGGGDAEDFVEEVAPVVGQPLLRAGARERLAREAGRQHVVGRNGLCVDLGDVARRRLAKVSGVGGGGVPVDLRCEDAARTDRFEAQPEAADAGEELHEAWGAIVRARPLRWRRRGSCRAHAEPRDPACAAVLEQSDQRRRQIRRDAAWRLSRGAAATVGIQRGRAFGSDGDGHEVRVFLEGTDADSCLAPPSLVKRLDDRLQVPFRGNDGADGHSASIHATWAKSRRSCARGWRRDLPGIGWDGMKFYMYERVDEV